ncbi:phosphoribosylanthranilate isomerase [uncultured Ilyobacter sp.]|uniref:phosphoribosylanthranilate isomerase n=1 Tax=uncultured Ilyobacter sp. TaxID=544433 RepID=UPI0029BFCD16|nr:phosphoribosylanthranilate isomerase [uncultured Ilyobacter sp.]
MTEAKICGIKNQSDVEIVNDLKPDYIGLVFAKSKRQVTLEKAAELSKNLDGKIKKVGVFVDEDPEKVTKIAKACELDILQFHGKESPEYCSSFKDYEIWKSFVGDENIIENIKKYDGCADAFLVDSSVPGSGKKFDWNNIKGLSESYKIILAGGLNPENIAEAVKKVKPQVVDVSSGVEGNNGKSREKVEKFIGEVRLHG